MSASRTLEPQLDQYVGATGPRTDVVLGLDYGTCWTKAVVRTPFARGGNAIAVPASDAGGTDYFMPTAFRFGAEGAHLCPHDAHGAIRESKLGLMVTDRLGDERLVAAVAEASTFLALAIRHTRRWYMQDQRTVLRGARLDWHLHVGVPSAGYDDLEVRRRFELAARAGWDLSLVPEPVTSEAALRAARVAIAHGPSARCLAVPEVVAEVVGYAVSPRRREGLHVMIDVGASTLDVCGFVLYRERSSHDRGYGILTARVERLGVVELSRRRLQALGRPAGVDDAVLEASAGWRRLEVPDPVVRAADEGMEKLARETIGSVIDALREYRDPNSPHWSEGLPVFMCGGGAEARSYQAAVSELDRDLRRQTRARGLTRVDSLDLTAWGRRPPAGLERRLGVAYGLSFDVIDIGEIRPPHDIGNIVRHGQSPRRCACLGVNEECPMCHGRGIVEPSMVGEVVRREARGARAPAKIGWTGREADAGRRRLASRVEALARALLTLLHTSTPLRNRTQFSVDCPMCHAKALRWDEARNHLRQAHQLMPIRGLSVRAAWANYETALTERLKDDPWFRAKVLCPRCNFVTRADYLRRHIAESHEQPRPQPTLPRRARGRQPGPR